MDPDNSPSLRNKRPRDETSDDKSGSNAQGRREVLQARLTNAVHDRAVDSGRQSPRTMSPSAAFVLLSAAAAGGPTVMTSLIASTPATVDISPVAPPANHDCSEVEASPLKPAP